MAEVLLINPKKRRKARSSPKRRASSGKRRVRRVRRSNPAPVVSTVRRVTRRRRANPIGRTVTRRRRRNPIGGSAKITAKGILSMVKDAAIGGAGAIGVDFLMGKINPHLPVSMRVSPTGIGAGDAVKALITVVLGKMLKKPTRGLSEKMALGALTTQARDLMTVALPASVTGSLAYYNPAAVVRDSSRVGPYRNAGVSAYQRPGGGTALLNGMSAYQAPGGPSPIVRTMPARVREGAIR